MSKRSRHGRGKHPHFRRKQKSGYFQPGTNTMQPSAMQPGGMQQPGVGQMQPGAMQPGTGVMPPTANNVPMATPPVTAAAPAPRAFPQPQAPVQKKSLSSAALPLHYEFIGSDLKRIGILTVIVVAILVITYLFLK